MLCTEDKLCEFLDWEQRAAMLSKNAIELFNLGPEFERTYQDRMEAFKLQSNVQAKAEAMNHTQPVQG